MADDEVEHVAAALSLSVGLLIRALRQAHAGGELTLPESSALARLERLGPMTSSALAKLEQISPQSMGATLAALESRGLLERHADPADGRRIVLTATEAALELLRSRRGARVQHLATALAAGFTPDEQATLLAATPLIERLAQTL